MTGYAGSRDYVGGPRSLRRRPHAYLYIPLKNRLRPFRKNSVRVTYFFKSCARRDGSYKYVCILGCTI